MSPIIERKYPNGTTVYGIRWTDEAGVDRKRFSKKWTKTQARAALAKVEEQLACGIATRVDMTVTDLFHDWHTHHAMLHCTPAWQQDSLYQFRLWSSPELTDTGFCQAARYSAS